MAAAINSYDIGQAVRISVEFTDAAGAAIDPTTVTASYWVPGLGIVTLTYGVDANVVREAVGSYYTDIDTTDAAGEWPYRWQGTGNVTVAADGVFSVADSQLVT